MTYNTPNLKKIASTITKTGATDKQPVKSNKTLGSKKDDKNSEPVIKIVITQAPDGSLSTDDGKEATQHDSVDDLLSHLSGRLGGGDSPDEDEDQDAQPSSSDGPMSALLGK